MAQGKKYVNAKKLVEESKLYELGEAVGLLAKTSTTKFDSTCEVHLRMGLDPKQADQMLRGTVVLPHGTGKKVRVIAFVPEAMEKQAKEAGAVEAGMHLMEKIMKENWLDFDVAVATPDVMKELSKVAKTLGQKGLMPNPKAGTVTPDIKKAIEDLMKGKVEYRLDKLANIHNIFGKVSFGEAKLEENLKSFLKAVAQARPTGAKGVFVHSITLATTMGPGIPLDVNSAMNVAKE